MAEPFYLGNDMALTLTSTTVSGIAASSATGTWTLYGADGSNIGSGNLTNDGSGNFTATCESSSFSSETAGTYGSLVFVVVQGSADGKFVTPVQFLDRGF